MAAKQQPPEPPLPQLLCQLLTCVLQGMHGAAVVAVVHHHTSILHNRQPAGGHQKQALGAAQPDATSPPSEPPEQPRPVQPLTEALPEAPPLLSHIEHGALLRLNCCQVSIYLGHIEVTQQGIQVWQLRRRRRLLLPPLLLLLAAPALPLPGQPGAATDAA
jgi:hypothetical protein